MVKYAWTIVLVAGVCSAASQAAQMSVLGTDSSNIKADLNIPVNVSSDTKVLVVIAGWEFAGPGVTGVTYDGTPMTLLADVQAASGSSGGFYLYGLASPTPNPAGTVIVQASSPGNNSNILGLVGGVEGVLAALPTNIEFNGEDVGLAVQSEQITTLNDGSLLLSAAFGGTTTTITPTNGTLTTVSANSSVAGLGSIQAGAAGVYDETYTFGNANTFRTGALLAEFAVPEPASIALIGLGATTLVLRRRHA